MEGGPTGETWPLFFLRQDTQKLIGLEICLGFFGGQRYAALTTSVW